MELVVGTDFWIIITQALGALGTIASVLFAIYNYRKSQNDASLLEVKKCLWRIPSICEEIDNLLSERVFSALGDSIASEFKQLYEKNQSLKDYSNFLIEDDRSHNYKAQAIYSGLKHCDEVAKINELIKEVEEVERTITLHFPCIGVALRKLFFYIKMAARRTMSPKLFSDCVSNGVENEIFMRAIFEAEKTNSSKLYFKEFSEYFSEISENSLRQNAHGQRTIDLSINMISLTCNVFGGMELGRLNRIRHADIRLAKKLKEYSEANSKTHAVEDAMTILKAYKKYYKEISWEEMIECKARTIENMGEIKK